MPIQNPPPFNVLFLMIQFDGAAIPDEIRGEFAHTPAAVQLMTVTDVATEVRSD